MISIYFINFFLGLGASFVGTIPFGPINLSVVNTTLKDSFRAAIIVSIGAALVEILQSFLALHCGLLVTNSIAKYPIIEVIIFSLFIALGIFFFFKKAKKPDEEKDTQKKTKISNFTKGLLVGLLNPQAIPFWVFVFALYMQSDFITDYEFLHITSFLIGVSVGKFLCLLLYAELSRVIVKRVKTLTLLINKIIGSIFILIGVVQVIKYFLN